MKNISQKLLSIPGVRWVWSVRNEITFLAILVILFSNLAGCLRAVDPTVAAFDIGLLMAPAIGIVAVAAAMLCVWAVWRFCLGKKQDQWFDGNVQRDDLGNLPPTFDMDWDATTPAVRIGTLLAVMFSVSLIIAAFALIFGKVA